MEQILHVDVQEPAVLLAADIVYSQKQEWCGGKYRQLKCSLLKPRAHYPYDDKQARYPLLVFLCGGSFAEVDRNLWMPELTYFAKHGWAVLGVDYSTIQLTDWPDQLTDVKAAIRYARAHAEEFCIDPDRIAVMGESAGGYLSLLAGCTNGDARYDIGDYLEQSSAVGAVVAWYPVTEIQRFCKEPFEKTHMPPFTANYPDLPGLMTPAMPATMLLHGSGDTLVPCTHSRILYEALQKNGVDSDLYLINGANHADHPFVQESVKALILKFLNDKLGG